MLKAMKEQLKHLAQTDQEYFHRYLRERVGKKATALLEEKLKEIIIIMPDLVTRVYFHWQRSPHPSPVKKLGGFLLTYLYTPEDFLSAKEWGLFGYLDDAYLVAKIYTRVIDEVREDHHRITKQDEQYYDLAKYLKKYVRGVIPKESKKIDEMLVHLEQGELKEFQEIFR